GAPVILSHLAKWCKRPRYFCDGDVTGRGSGRRALGRGGYPGDRRFSRGTGYDRFIQFGQQSLSRSHESFTAFARNFDCVIASTIFGAPLIHDATAKAIPLFWWIHEGLVGDHFIRKFPILASTIGLAEFIVTPDQRSRQIYQP